MSTTTIPTNLAHDIAARLCQEADNGARELRTRLMACMQDATSPGLDESIDDIRARLRALSRETLSPDEHREGLAVEERRLQVAVNGPAPIEPAANAPEVEPARAETSEWRANLEADQEAEPPEFKPVAGPLGLAIFVGGDYVDARDAYAAPRKGEILTVNGKRCMVSLVEWTGPTAANVHTQPLLRLPSADGGPF